MEVSFVTLCSVLNILCEMGFCGVIVWMALLLLKCFSLISFSVQSIINSITWLKFLISVLETALKKNPSKPVYSSKSNSDEDGFPKHYQNKGKDWSAALCRGRVEEAAWTVMERRVMSGYGGKKIAAGQVWSRARETWLAFWMADYFYECEQVIWPLLLQSLICKIQRID